MGTINLENLQPGMVLARDAKDPGGRVLLVAGTSLTEKHLRVFKIWGVSEAEIEGVDPKEVAAQEAARVDPALLKDAGEKVQALFAYTDGAHPAIAELKRLTIQRMVHDVKEGAG